MPPLTFTRRSVLIGAGAAVGTGLLPTSRALAADHALSSGPVQLLNRSNAPSQFFRIPFLIRTASDTLIAGCDANRATTGDSADNIDAVIRRKEKASGKAINEGWDAPAIIDPIDMKDFLPTSGYAQDSASVIDGIIAQDRTTGRILLIIDLFPWNGGVFEHLNVLPDNSVRGGRARSIAQGDGFATVAGRKMLLLSTSNIKGNADGLTGNINDNTDRTRFDRVADVHGPKDSYGRTAIYVLHGTPRPYQNTEVDDSNLSLGPATEYSLDAEFHLYKNESLLTLSQVGSGASVPMKVFYKDSPLQVFNTNFTAQVISDDEGRTWRFDRLLNPEFRAPDSHYSLVGPGTAIQMAGGRHAGRILVPIYTQVAAGVKGQCIYTDDGGQTWTRGSYIPGTTPMHESAVIEVLPGVLRSFNRHALASGGRVLTCESTDGGRTWSPMTSAFGDNNPGVGCEVSALALRQKLTSNETGEQLPSLVVVSPDTRARKHGVAHYGVVHETPGGATQTRIEWVGTYDITTPETLFAYSSLAEMDDGTIYCLFETSPTTSWGDGLAAMYIQELVLPKQPRTA